MKLSLIFLLVCLITVNAQRRSSVTKNEEIEQQTAKSTRGRGRTRFSLPPEVTPSVNEENSSQDGGSRRQVTRKRPLHTVATLERRAPVSAKINSQRRYEVEELVDESPIETYRRQSKPRVLTETHFEAPNSPKRPLFRPSSNQEEVSVEELLKNFGSSLENVKSTEATSDIASSTSAIETSQEQTNDLTTNPTGVSVEEKTTENSNRKQESSNNFNNNSGGEIRKTNVRKNIRSRSGSGEKVDSTTATAPRTRVRATRVSKRPVDHSPTATTAPTSPSVGSRTVTRAGRKRVDTQSSTDIPSRGPSIFATEEARSSPQRTRTGRKIDRAPEKISIDLEASTRKERLVASRRNALASSTERHLNALRRTGNRFANSKEEVTNKPSQNIRSRTSFPSRHQNYPTTEHIKHSRLDSFRRRSDSTTKKSEINKRGRNFHSKSTTTTTAQPTASWIEDQFKELESINSPKLNSLRSRSKTSSEETVQTSATENDLKFTHPEKVSVTVSVETRTESSVRRGSKPIFVQKPKVKESVIAEVTEVTSKRTVGRRLPNDKTVKVVVDEPKISVSQTVSRGRKKSEIKLNNNKNKTGSSEEDISDSDNYPEPFKSLIQAKKNKKESRPPPLRSVSSILTNNNERIVTSSEASTTSTTTTSTTTSLPIIHTSAAIREDENENELEPKLAVTTPNPKPNRPTRRRFSLATKPSFRESSERSRSKAIRSTASPPISAPASKEHRFHAKFSTTLKPEYKRNSTRPSFINRSKDISKNQHANKNLPEPPIFTTSIPKSSSLQRSNRFSSRYRNDLSGRGTIVRSTTAAPVYIPTIPTAVYIPTVPTVTPPTTTVVSGVATKDVDLGLEVITFDDPVNTISSANLVSEELLSSTDLNNSVTVVPKVAPTEKTVSIIERIINSITAISTTSSPDPKIVTTVTEAPNISDSSAILKLASKKSTKSDKTIDKTNIPTSTSETPTTVIERILSSLSAIQANDGSNTNQVGTDDFNTISLPSTTPTHRLTHLSTLSAQSSTINPLSVLDEISEEQVLQKRTIGKLLALLNGLTSTTPKSESLVVVTPKPTSTISTTTVPQATTLSSTTTSETPETSPPTTQPPTTSSPLFTSNPAKENTEIESRVGNNDSTSLMPPTTNPPSTSRDIEMTTPPSPKTSPTSSTIDDIKDIDLLPLFVSPGATNLLTESTTPLTVGTTASTTTDTDETETVFTFPSTLPTLVNFEVSPGSVSVFSANDLSNAITSDDNLYSTVTISSRNNFNTDPTTITSTTESNSNNNDGTTTNDSTTNVTTESTTTNSNNETTTTGMDSSTASSNSSVTEISMMDTLANTSNISDSNSNNTNVSNNTVSNNSTTSSNNSSISIANRSGRLLSVVQDPVQNNIDSSPSSTTPDYFIFAVLPNNTILRKRPSTLPNKEVPFLIVGVLPNNTIVRKFPNGTVVPMEPIIRVRGFDTRENPPPLPEITSNQVTNDPGSPTDNKNVQTVDSKSVPPLQPNPLSTPSSVDVNPITTSTTTTITQSPSTDNSRNSATSAIPTTAAPTTLPPTTSTTAPSTITTAAAATTTTTTPSPTIPPLVNILNGDTLSALNDIINNTNSGTSTTTTTTTTAPATITTTTQAINKESTTMPTTKMPETTTVPTTKAPDATTAQTVTNAPVITPRLTKTETTTIKQLSTVPEVTTLSNTVLDNLLSTSAPTTTIAPLTSRPITTFRTTTGFYPNLFSSIITALEPRLSTILPPTVLTDSSIESQTETEQILAASTSRPSTTAAPKRGSVTFADTITSTNIPQTTTTVNPTTTTLPSIRTTTAPITTTPPSTTTEFTTARPSRTTTNADAELFTSAISTTSKSSASTAAPKLKQLTEEQKKNLEAIAQLEKEQAVLLQQLQILTRLGLGGNNNNNKANNKDKNKATTPSSSSLANRIIALAVERDKAKSSTPSSIQDQLSAIDEESKRNGKKLSSTSDAKPSLEDILKQYNTTGIKGLTDSSPVPPTYGKSNDAILAALLKEQGIVPTTPKVLSNIYRETTTTRKPKPRTTTRPPGRLMQGLNWLLNVLAPQPTTTTTRKPKASRKPKAKKPEKVEEELLTNQPTHITPVVTASPKTKSPNALSQEDIGKLIKQLEAIQKNPKEAELDLSQIKSLQNLINTNEGVQVVSSAENGARSRSTTRKPKTETTKKRERVVKSTTPIPTSTVSNSLEFDDEVELISTTQRPKVSLPPVRLRPVPGIDENSDPFIRGNLITAAVNVTRAITTFLGSALQGAANSFQTLISTGSRLVGNYSSSGRPG